MAPPSPVTATSGGSTLNGVVIGLLSSFGSAVILALIFFAIYFFRYTLSGRIILDRFGRPGEYDDEQAFAREEAEALEDMDDMQRIEYLRAKAFVAANPPESVQTDISLSQFLAIQEKGVSAWEFEPELEIANCFVEARTEIEFFDSECTVMSNLPVPKQNEVYYWEAKIYDKPENTMVCIGMATKPYPLFRLPGFHKYSVAYTSNGFRRFNQPFGGTPYGPHFVQGDVVGVGYRPRTGTIFFTRNGKRLEDVIHGLKAPNFFPAVGANGPCIVHVNLGQAGFVFIEANVKKWGLAPSTGSLAPPPPYGAEQDSILLESGRKDGFNGGSSSSSMPGPYRPHSLSQSLAHSSHANFIPPQHGRSRSGNFRILSPISPGPARSPTDISLAQLVRTDDGGEPSGAASRPGRPDSMLGLGLQDALNPPPEYSSPVASPHGSDAGSRRGSLDSDDGDDNDRAPLLRPATQSRSRSATVGVVSSQAPQPPIPSYSDAVQQGAGRDRSDTARSAR
jgi:hypothetical protein